MIKSYLKNIHINKIIFLFIAIISTILVTLYCFYAEGYNDWKNYLLSTSEFSEFGIPLEFYYYLQSTSHTIGFSFITFIAVTNIFATDRIIHKKNGFCNMMKTRVGYKKYMRNELILNTIFSVIFILVLQVVMLLTIRILVGPFDFSSMRHIDFINDTNIFTGSPAINLVVYVIFSIVGYTLYSNFLFTLGFFIKNVYVYRGIGIIMSILLTALPAMIFITLYRMFNFNLFMDIGSLLFLPNLLNPGIQLLDSFYMIFNSPYLNFISSCVFVSLITMILYHIGSGMEYKYD